MKVRKQVISRFSKSKDLLYCTFFDLLDILIPSTFNICTAYEISTGSRDLVWREGSSLPY